MMHALLNEDRARAGLPPLTYDESLADVGRAHSFDMMSHGFFAHESSLTGSLEDRLVRAGVLFVAARENLALDDNVPNAERHLMESPGHKANILATDITAVGIGIVFGPVPSDMGEGEGLFATQVFARRAHAITPLELAAKVRTRIHDARKAKGFADFDRTSNLDQAALLAVEKLSISPTKADITTAAQEITTAVPDLLRQGGSLSLAVVVVAEAEGFELPPGTTHASARAIGIGARRVTDEIGRPVVLLLLVTIGR